MITRRERERRRKIAKLGGATMAAAGFVLAIVLTTAGRASSTASADPDEGTTESLVTIIEAETEESRTAPATVGAENTEIDKNEPKIVENEAKTTENNENQEKTTKTDENLAKTMKTDENIRSDLGSAADYSDEDYYWLLRCVQAEQSEFSYRACYLTACCIINRALNSGMSFTDVIFEAGQFQVVSLGWIYDAEPAEQTIEAVNDALLHPETWVIAFSIGHAHDAWAAPVEEIETPWGTTEVFYTSKY